MKLPLKAPLLVPSGWAATTNDQNPTGIEHVPDLTSRFTDAAEGTGLEVEEETTVPENATLAWLTVRGVEIAYNVVVVS